MAPSFPPGVINCVPSLGNVGGAALSAHPGVDKVAFTGSTITGRKIMEAAAKSNLKKVRGEPVLQTRLTLDRYHWNSAGSLPASYSTPLISTKLQAGVHSASSGIQARTAPPEAVSMSKKGYTTSSSRFSLKRRPNSRLPARGRRT